MIRSYQDSSPQLHDSVWVAADAQVIGDVRIGASSSVWFQSVLRGDVNYVRIGERSNIQDHCTIHVSSGTYPTVIGNDVTVGHRVVLHGCRIGDGALVGIASVVLDDAEIEEGALLGAMSLLTPGSRVPAGKVAMGQPARVIRDVSEAERRWMAESSANYVKYAARYARRPE